MKKTFILSLLIFALFLSNKTYGTTSDTLAVPDNILNETIYDDIPAFEAAIDNIIKSNPDTLVMYSSDENIATIDNDGNVTGTGIGTTTVHVYYENASEDGKTASCVVSVSGTKVTLNPNDGALNTTSITVLCGKPYDKLPVPVRAGYSFDGWFNENDELITDETIVPTYEDHTLRAKWSMLPSYKPVTKTGEYSYDVILNQRGYVNVPEIGIIKGSKDKWSVQYTDKKIASINKNGKIYASRVGNTIATITRGSTAFTINITVTLPTYEYKKVIINTGDTLDVSLKGTVLHPTYTTSNARIVTVSEDGVITAHLYGSARITAALCGVKYNLTIVVDDPYFYKTDISLLNNAQFRQRVLKVRYPAANIVWESENPEIAPVTNKGVISPKKTGKTTVHAYVNGRDLTCRVKVDHPVISETAHTLNIGESFYLSLNETEYTPVWKSSNKKIATVDEKGHVVALKRGSVIISTKINKVTFKCKVTVQ